MLLTATLVLLASSASAENLSLLNAMRTIQSNELKEYVDALADDTFEGRAAGARGGRAAGNYLMQEMRRFGLRPAGEDGGYAQSFPRGLRNFLGLIEGSDPDLKNEVIVVSAHYDHVGYGTAKNSRGPIGYVHNGADDNASGVAGLLEIMEAFSKGPRPKRSILFAFWDGEEAGLLGSKHWTAHPTIDLKQIALMVNVDMIGRLRDRKLIIYGWRSGPGLRRLVAEANAGIDLRLNFDWEYKNNSDHHSFFQKGIPVVMLHTGLHDDYHTPHDDAHLINVAGMEEVTRLLFKLVFEAADRQERFAFRAAAEDEAKDTQALVEAPLLPAKPRIGMRWKEVKGGVQIVSVKANGTAQQAGLRPGDRILEIDGDAVTSTRQLLGRVLTAKDSIDLLVQRGGATSPQKATVPLQGNPIRIGMSWRVDNADPTNVIVTQIVAGGPAYWSGLKTGDRVYGINEEDIVSSDALHQNLITLPSPIDLLIEREGQLRQVTIEPPTSE